MKNKETNQRAKSIDIILDVYDAIGELETFKKFNTKQLEDAASLAGDLKEILGKGQVDGV